MIIGDIGQDLFGHVLQIGRAEVAGSVVVLTPLLSTLGVHKYIVRQTPMSLAKPH